jgi:rod shape-determining protein MreC
LLERPRSTLVVLVLLAISLITLSFKTPDAFKLGSLRSLVTGIVDPAREGLDSLARPVVNAYKGIVEYPRVASEVARLKDQLEKAKRQELENQGALLALAQLSRLENLPWVNTLPSLPAQVIGITPSNLQLSFEINRGSASGVQIGNPVIGGAGLAGRVIQVTSDTATVLMITDPSSVVGVRIAKTGQVGALTGEGSGVPLSVGLVTPGTPLRKGAILITSGLQGELFPPGIPAAKVVSVSNPSGDLQESIRAVPLVNYQSLQYVSVLKWVPGGGL